MFQTVEVRDDLTTLKKYYRMYHYGILGIIEDPAKVEKLVNAAAIGILKKMRELLGSDREHNKVFVGVGYYFYDGKNAWADLAYTADNVALPEVDIVVILTTVVTMPSNLRCRTLPVNAYKSQDTRTPTLDKAYHIATTDFSRPDLVVALALQMGVAVYSYEERPNSANSALYGRCNGFGISAYSEACQVPETGLHIEKTVIGLDTLEQAELLMQQRLLAFDKLYHLIDKATIIMQRPDIRTNLTWMLLNADLTDSTGFCLSAPFQRLKGFRDFYYRQAQMPKG
ncbi:uncharacterized protein [Dermacentor albipictus]|uniref:uncharacterized protein n=1 Tax=Dermacentor albipictus TaxID=60249 RepID=UPI0031FCC463